MSNEFIELFDDWAKGYHEKYSNLSRYSEPISFFCDLLDNSPSILDLACGPGNMAAYILNKIPKAKFTGIDAAPKMIEIARKVLPTHDWKIMNVNEFSYNSSYHAIIISFLLPYLNPNDLNKLWIQLSKNSHKKTVIYLSFILSTSETKKSIQLTSDNKKGLESWYYSLESISEMIQPNFHILRSFNYDAPNNHDQEAVLILSRK